MRAIIGALLLAFAPIAANAQSYQLAGPGFWGGSTATTVSVGASLRYTITNPAGSGVNCVVFQISVYSTQVAYGHFWVNPTTNLPATNRTENDVYIGGSDVAQCQVRSDAGTGMSGGIDTGDDLAIPANTTAFQPRTMIVPPGATLGLNVPVTVLATTAVTFFWRESSL